MRLVSMVLIGALAASAGVQGQTAGPTGDAPVAPPSGETQNARKACRSDAMKVCPGKRGNEARACLEGNAEKISTNCKDALAKLPPVAPKS